MMELSRRLRTVAGAVTPGFVPADIGTDHAYVPIWLVKEGICPRAFAMDVNAGPLERAKDHIAREGLSDRIICRLSNGLEKLKPREADSIIIAGMGGDLTCRILSGSPASLLTAKELILQPQSEWFKVRRFLRQHGFMIEREWFLKEDGKYYLVIRAVPEKERGEKVDVIDQEVDGERLEEIFSCYGDYLLKVADPVLLEYLEKEYKKKTAILSDLEARKMSGHSRFVEIKKEIEYIDYIVNIYYNLNIHTT